MKIVSVRNIFVYSSYR